MAAPGKTPPLGSVTDDVERRRGAADLCRGGWAETEQEDDNNQRRDDARSIAHANCRPCRSGTSESYTNWIGKRATRSSRSSLIMALSQQAVVDDDLSIVRDRQSEQANGSRIVLECRGPGPLPAPLRQGAALDWIPPILIPGYRPRNRDQGTQWPIRQRTRRSGAAGLRPTARSRRLLSRSVALSSFHQLTRGPPISSPSEVSRCFRPSAR